MSYVKTTDFAGKDSLLTGDPLKVIKGSEFGVEFDNIATDSTTNLKKDGSVAATANIPMGGFKLTGLAAGTLTGDAARYDELNAHIVDTVAAHAASAVSNTPAGGIAATDVQAAINELDTEKAALAGASFTGGINETGATVAAHATTCPIWTAANGNSILLSGAAVTFTAFPNAPQAYAKRTIIMNAAHSITAGANMIIAGIASGQTITLAANDIVDVEALSTTQFYMRITHAVNFVSSTVAVGSAVSLTTNTAANVTSISLPAGEWDISGNVLFSPAATTSITALAGNSGATSATQNAVTGFHSRFSAIVGGAVTVGQAIPTNRVSINSTTTYYLVAYSLFTVSTLGAYGTIYANRATT